MLQPRREQVEDEYIDLEQKRNLQLDSTPGSDLVDSADTTAAVSAPDMSTSGALASGAAGTGPVLQTSRQSYPTLQPTTNTFEDERLYNWGDLAPPDLPSSPHAGGVTDYRSPAFPFFPSQNSDPLLWTESDTGTVVPGSVESLPPFFPHEFDEHGNRIGNNSKDPWLFPGRREQTRDDSLL